MPESALDRLRRLCGGPRDGGLLRVSIANELLAQGDTAAAIDELREAVRRDPAYSAAWKLLGKALAELGADAQARQAYRDGIAAAQQRGDKQAEKEMVVFLRRLDRRATPP